MAFPWDLPYDLPHTAFFSPSRTHRYLLWRSWGEVRMNGFLAVIGLNPSTADETQDDPTIRRCIRFAKDWGLAGLCMLNLFAFRATDPRVMMRADDPVGPENDAVIHAAARHAALTLAAWGTHGGYRGRDREVQQEIATVHCLGTTKGGFPRHPLYVKADVKPVLL